MRLQLSLQFRTLMKGVPVGSPVSGQEYTAYDLDQKNNKVFNSL